MPCNCLPRNSTQQLPTIRWSKICKHHHACPNWTNISPRRYDCIVLSFVHSTALSLFGFRHVFWIHDPPSLRSTLQSAHRKRIPPKLQSAEFRCVTDRSEHDRDHLAKTSECVCMHACMYAHCHGNLEENQKTKNKKQKTFFPMPIISSLFHLPLSWLSEVSLI
jgi:hypothetical protein